MGKLCKNIGKTALIFFILLLLLFGSAWMYLKTDKGQNFAKDHVTNFLESKTGLDITLEKVDVNIFKHAILKGLTIAQQNDTLLSVGTLEAKVKLTKLLERKLVSDKITLKNASSSIVIEEDGSTNFDNITALLPKQNPNNSFFLDLDKVNLQQIHFDLTNHQTGTFSKAHLKDLALSINELDIARNVFNINKVDIDGLALTHIDSAKTFTPKEVLKDSTLKKQPIELAIHAIEITNSSFLQNKITQPSKAGFDPNHLNLNLEALKIKDVSYAHNNGEAKILKTTLEEKNSTFRLDDFSTNMWLIDNELLHLEELSIQTPNTQIKDDLSISIKSNSDGKPDVKTLKAVLRSKSSKISITDIQKIAPAITKNKFIQNNPHADIDIDGTITYYKNRISGKNLTLNLADKVKLKGQVTARNINDSKKLLTSLQVDHLSTSIQNLESLVSIKNLPEGFQKLGKIDFSGKFDGLLNDFVANGRLKTELGDARTNLRMTLQDGFSDGTYSGDLDIEGFDLGTFLGDTTLGITTFHTAVSGSGFDLASLNTKLDGKIDSISYKGYTYYDVDINALIRDKFFNGNLKTNDKNIDIALNGKVDMADSIPVFDAVLNATNLDLQKLKLIDKPLIISGKTNLDFKGKKIDDIIGHFSGSDIVITMPKRVIKLDEIDINIEEKRNSKFIRFTSPIANGKIDGDFSLSNLGTDIQYFLIKNYPKVYDILSTNNQVSTFQNYDYKNDFLRFDLTINDRDSLLESLLDEPILLVDTKAKGIIDFRDELVKFKLKSKEITFRNNTINRLHTATQLQKDTINIQLHTDSIFAGKIKSTGLDFNASGDENKVLANLSMLSLNNLVNNINLDTELLDYSKEDISFAIKQNSSFILDTLKWDVQTISPIHYKKRHLSADGVSIKNKDQELLLTADGKKANLSLENVSIHFINEFLKDERLVFDGILNTSFSVDNLFELSGLSLKGGVQNIDITGQQWGDLNYEVKTSKISELVQGSFSVGRSDYNIGGDINYFPPKFRDSTLQNSVDISADIKDFPFDFFDYFFGDGVKNSVGTVDGTFSLDGLITDPNLSFKLLPKNVATTVAYLNTRYILDRDSVTMSNTLVDFTGARIKDQLGNTATARGGFTHQFFKDFRLDVGVKSDNFMLLNTTEEENTDYYGVGIGKADVLFTGSFTSPHISMNLETNKGTQFNIPVEGAERTSDNSFVTFIKRDTLETEKEEFKLRGFSIDMDISVTEDAEMRLIFDENTGDVIRSRGEGSIRLGYSLAGQFDVFGQYRISEGDYLFTYQDFINKPFAVRPGGTISWAGDPYDAILDIDAIYSLKTAPFNFIVEYLNESDTRLFNEASNTTQVDLFMKITEDLENPKINFDFKFPQLSGPLKSFAETKLRVLRSDQNNLNRQVFGLIVLGSFLPSNETAGTFGSGDQIITNTLSELVSNQISNYLTDIFSEAFTDVSFINDLRFKVKYNQQNYDQDLYDVSSTSELEVGLQNTLLNQKLLISVGGNFDVGGSNDAVAVSDASGTYIAGDFLIEYKLTADGRFRVKGYRTTDLTIEGRQNKTGIGLTYRKEFDNFKEFVASMKDSVKKKKNKKGGSSLQ